MVEFDIATVVSICLAVAAIIGLFFAATQYWQLVRQRKTEMLIRIYPGYNIEHAELRTAERIINRSNYVDFSDFEKKFGQSDSDSPVPVAFDKIGNYYEGLGLLLKQKLVDIDLLYALIGPKIICYWEKMLPYTNGLRKSCGDDLTWAYFEYLYNEMKVYHK